MDDAERAERLILQTRETIGGLRVVLADLRKHVEELEAEVMRPNLTKEEI